MGFFNLAAISGCIENVYFIDAQINALMQRKYTLSMYQMDAGNQMSEAFSMRAVAANPSSRVFSGDQNTILNPEAQAMYEQAKQLMELLKNEEKFLDLDLEQLRAKRAAAQQQKEEFQKYVAEGIKSTFKNNYA